MSSSGKNIAVGDGPEYLVCAPPYKDVSQAPQWGLDTALAIVEEAVDAFDPVSIEAKPPAIWWPPGLASKGEDVDVFDLMRGAYFSQGMQYLPDIGRPVPQPEKNFYTWLCCRKKQWRQYRASQRMARRPTPEEDFQKWLRQRKMEWSSMKLHREASKTPVLEENFYQWLAERKKVWRLQRLARKHVDH